MKYLQEIATQVNVDYQTFWLSTLYFRQSINKGILDPSKSDMFIISSMVCLSMAIKFDECGQQMVYLDQINSKNMAPQHRNTKHKALYQMMKLTILAENTNIALMDPKNQTA
jgi:hypothetical protein